jgi:hypothetical protein
MNKPDLPRRGVDATKHTRAFIPRDPQHSVHGNARRDFRTVEAYKQLKLEIVFRFQSTQVETGPSRFSRGPAWVASQGE